MRKITGKAAARQAFAPESRVTLKNTHQGDNMHTKNAIATERKPVSKRPTARMPATSRIPVSRAVWGELSSLRKPGETYDHLLEEMVEREKKHRLFEDMDRIEKRGKFVAMKW